MQGELSHNGFGGGDAGHGGFVKIKIIDGSSCSIEVELEDNHRRKLHLDNLKSLAIIVRGDSERENLIEILEKMLIDIKNV